MLVHKPTRTCTYCACVWTTAGLSEDASSFATLTEFSDASSQLGTDTDTGGSSGGGCYGGGDGSLSATSSTFDLSQLEQLSHELANKGPKQSEVELRWVHVSLRAAAVLEIMQACIMSCLFKQCLLLHVGICTPTCRPTCTCS